MSGEVSICKLHQEVREHTLEIADINVARVLTRRGPAELGIRHPLRGVRLEVRGIGRVLVRGSSLRKIIRNGHSRSASSEEGAGGT